MLLRCNHTPNTDIPRHHEPTVPSRYRPSHVKASSPRKSPKWPLPSLQLKSATREVQRLPPRREILPNGSCFLLWPQQCPVHHSTRLREDVVVDMVTESTSDILSIASSVTALTPSAFVSNHVPHTYLAASTQWYREAGRAYVHTCQEREEGWRCRERLVATRFTARGQCTLYLN